MFNLSNPTCVTDLNFCLRSSACFFRKITECIFWPMVTMLLRSETILDWARFLCEASCCVLPQVLYLLITDYAVPFDVEFTLSDDKDDGGDDAVELTGGRI